VEDLEDDNQVEDLTEDIQVEDLTEDNNLTVVHLDTLKVEPHSLEVELEEETVKGMPAAGTTATNEQHRPPATMLTSKPDTAVASMLTAQLSDFKLTDAFTSCVDNPST
jgi:hypothetical protein